MKLHSKDLQAISEAYQGSVLKESKDVLYFSPTPGHMKQFNVGDDFFIKGLKGIDSGTIIAIDGATGDVDMRDGEEGWTVNVKELNAAAGLPRAFYIQGRPIHGLN
jgi:hypothetical protein